MVLFLKAIKKSSVFRTEKESEFVADFTKRYPYLQRLYQENNIFEMEFHSIISEYLCYEIHYKGEAIFFKGDKAKNFYLIIHGGVRQLELKSQRELAQEKRDL